jgi:anti-sigma28 factor (negative regulator of flagellin synthesis)
MEYKQVEDTMEKGNVSRTVGGDADTANARMPKVPDVPETVGPGCETPLAGSRSRHRGPGWQDASDPQVDPPSRFEMVPSQTGNEAVMSNIVHPTPQANRRNTSASQGATVSIPGTGSKRAKKPLQVAHGSKVREDLVARVKAEIEAGTYETEQRIERTVDRLCEELFPELS